MQQHLTLYSLCLCLASCSLISLTSCDGPHKGEEDQLKETVDTFASAYFNWHYKDALQLVDSASRKWIIYAASNVHQADIDLLRAMPEGATFHIKDIDYIFLLSLDQHEGKTLAGHLHFAYKLRENFAFPLPCNSCFHFNAAKIKKFGRKEYICKEQNMDSMKKLDIINLMNMQKKY